MEDGSMENQGKGTPGKWVDLPGTFPLPPLKRNKKGKKTEWAVGMAQVVEALSSTPQ
jgi:hypothetical protein